MRFSSQLAALAALLATAVLVLLGVTHFHRETASFRPVVPPYDLFWCTNDADCGVVDRIGCCSCREGGAQAAVTKWHQDDLRRFLKTACRPHRQQVCVHVDLCRSDAKAKCVDRRCRITY
jgi:hypothetical protein